MGVIGIQLYDDDLAADVRDQVAAGLEGPRASSHQGSMSKPLRKAKRMMSVPEPGVCTCGTNRETVGASIMTAATSEVSMKGCSVGVMSRP
jgi:hypothetical protein